MLTELDESLLHQAAATFDDTIISDHRFFDRMVDIPAEEAAAIERDASDGGLIFTLDLMNPKNLYLIVPPFVLSLPIASHAFWTEGVVLKPSQDRGFG